MDVNGQIETHKMMWMVDTHVGAVSHLRQKVAAFVFVLISFLLFMVWVPVRPGSRKENSHPCDIRTLPSVISILFSLASRSMTGTNFWKASSYQLNI